MRSLRKTLEVSFTALGIGLVAVSVLGFLGAWPAREYFQGAPLGTLSAVYLVGCGLVLLKFATRRPVLPLATIWGGRHGLGVALLAAPVWVLIEGAAGMVGWLERRRSSGTGGAGPSGFEICPGAGLGPLRVGTSLEAVMDRLGDHVELGRVRNDRVRWGGRLVWTRNRLPYQLRALGAQLRHHLRGETTATVADHDVTLVFGPDDRLQSVEIRDPRATVRDVHVVGRRWPKLLDAAGDAYWIADPEHEAARDWIAGRAGTTTPPIGVDIALPAAGLRLTLLADQAVACTVTAPFVAAGTPLRRVTPGDLKRLPDHAAEHAARKAAETLRRRWRRTVGIAAALGVFAAAVVAVAAYPRLGAHLPAVVAAAAAGCLLLRLLLLRGIPAPEIELPGWPGTGGTGALAAAVAFILRRLGIQVRGAVSRRDPER